MTPLQQVQNKCKEVVEKAKLLYNVDLSVVSIQFNLKGRTAGWAEWRTKGAHTTYKCRFNYDMLVRGDEKALKDMLEDTVPHEMAHIVCFMRPELGKNHDAGWQNVCVGLGGTAARCHKLEVVYGRGKTYEYTTDRGHKVRLNDRLHGDLLSGLPIRYRKGLGTVRPGSSYTIVGISGRSLAQPIPVAAMNAPAVIEAAVRAPVIMPPESFVLVPRVVQPATPPVRPVVHTGESKAAVSRRIMLSGYRSGQSYEMIIAAMIAANGYDRGLARATFKANRKKVGIPDTFV